MGEFFKRARFAGVSGAALILAGGAGAAQAAEAAASSSGSGSAVDELIVTGTRSTSRTVTTSLAPIDVLTATADHPQPWHNPDRPEGPDFAWCPAPE